MTASCSTMSSRFWPKAALEVSTDERSGGATSAFISGTLRVADW